MSYEVLHRFRGRIHHDGANAEGSLVNVNGTLYGTTRGGGNAGCYESIGCGTIFSVTTSGAEKVLHRFDYSDGASPRAGLINVHGTLYGTTEVSSPGGGTVFSMTTRGVEKVLYIFGQRSGDGVYPEASLIDVHGVLYGTTYYGGSGCLHSSGCGTVFGVATTGREKVLHRFHGGSDGAHPFATLINVGGTLYGTTTGGGASEQGTIFSITTTGKESVLYRFAGGSDGANPEAGLVNVKGTLYGTTYYGGANGYGTVFTISATGEERVLHSFAGGSDGAYPSASLINVKSTLYGTTSEGGDAGRCGSLGCGTVFSVTTSGTENVLHSFGGANGAVPLASLIDVQGLLYGTTYYGGDGGCHRNGGCGTVFALSP